jgi:hypothetical protein
MKSLEVGETVVDGGNLYACEVENRESLSGASAQSAFQAIPLKVQRCLNRPNLTESFKIATG